MNHATSDRSRQRLHLLRWLALGLALLLLLVLDDHAATVPPAPAVMTLAQCEQVAEQQQPDLEAARRLVEETAQRIQEAHAGHRPQLDIGASHAEATYNYAAQPGTSPRLVSQLSGAHSNSVEPYYNAGLNFNLPLFDFGRTKGAVMSAEAEYRAAMDNVRTVRDSVYLAVQNSYYTVLAAQALVEVRSQAVDNQRRHLDEARAFYQVGRRPRIDVTQQQVALADAQFNLAQAQADLNVARSALATAMGIPIDQAPKPVDTLGTVHPQPDLNQLMTEADRRRPDIEQLREQVVAAQGEAIVAHAALRPQIGISSFLDFRNLGFPLINNWGFAELLTQTLLDGGYKKARLAEVQKAEQVARANLASFRLKVREQVYNAWSDEQVATEKIDLARKAATEAAENLALAEGRYAAGVGSGIELTDAQLLATRTQTQVVTAQYAWQMADGRLQTAIGEEPH